MKKDYITAGEFARLACTTKRTILWYDQKGILKPTKIGESGIK
jgi:DNA-binding transcriptional MerR regulator